MNKEEAIKYLQQLYPNGGHCWLDEQRIEAIGMAVKALQEEPVSEELEEAANEIVNKAIPPLAVKYKDGTYVGRIRDCFDRKEFIDLVKAGAKWQKKRDYIPLSDDINEVARQICNKVLNCEIDYKEDDVVLSDEEECVKAGIRWQMQKESILSKDLEELINSLSKQFPEVSFAKLSRIAVRVAKWHKEQFEKNRLKHCNSITNEQAGLESDFIDQHLDKHQRMPTFLDAIEYGMKLQRENMMKDAVDAVVHIEAGNYPYIPQLELYDYDKDIPLANEGDKYKVVLIKEE